MLNKPVKILQCYRTFFPESQGGVEQVILEVARLTGGEVLTLASSSVGEGHFGGVAYSSAKRWFSLASCCVGPGMLRLLNKKSPDLLHFHFPWPFGDLVYLLAGSSRPLVITYHSDVVRQRFLGALYRPLMKRFFARADRIVATSQNYVESSEILKDYRHKTEVIPLGISESGYPRPSDEALASVEERFGRDFMLFVGVLRYYKGLEFLVRAALGQPYRIVIAGSGPEEARLKALAVDLGIDNVIFAGFVDEVEKMALFQLCRATVFPSHIRSEAFGVTLLEGLMCGKPLISCEIGTGTSYVNQHEETGYVVPPADPDSLRDAMSTLWHNPEKAVLMGHKGRQRYERLFTGERMATAYARLYESVLSERRETN
ncbi:glycosyltransferase [Microbulbifer sp. SA54]|uniref:glycosyltransferase n=1 Tax=Microbulbifer sp. SA54 TaxID=3401577 RepID=UPI003AACE083